MNTIWGNIDGCEDQYRCATQLYLLSILEHAYNIIIDRGFRATIHNWEIVDGLKTTYKSFLSTLIKNMQLTGDLGYDTHM